MMHCRPLVEECQRGRSACGTSPNQIRSGHQLGTPQRREVWRSRIAPRAPPMRWSN